MIIIYRYYLFMLVQVGIARLEIISPNTVRNDVTDETYNSVLLNPMVQELVDYVAGVRDRSYDYIPDDVGLVQSIMSAQMTMFQLASYYAQFYSETSITRYEGGLAIEFETHRCDKVHDAKFPRSRTNTIPWTFYRDSAYVRINCGLQTSSNSRKRRTVEAVESTKKKYSRQRRAYVKQLTPNESMFHNGKDSSAPELTRTCGSRMVSVKTTSYYLTVVFRADDTVGGTGFKMNWTLSQGLEKHPGYVLTSVIAVDQVGDLSSDTFDFDTLEIGQEHDDHFISDYKLKLTDPSTCPLENDDTLCYFDSTPSLISKIIAVDMEPALQLPQDAVEVVFEHVFEVDKYPELYESPKYCLVWDPSTPNTEYGSWTRKSGRLHDTNIERTICRYSKSGIFALGAAVPPPQVPPLFRFTISWYCGLLFTCVWVILTLVKTNSTKMNVPDWLNTNQLCGLLVFCCIVLSGMHLELDPIPCSMLSFALYYFGLSVFVWHLLKAAQFTGTFDKFFRAERNIYTFYFFLGWGIPFFIAGMAGGAEFYPREKKQSCWLAMKGGSIIGETAPAYFLVVFIFYLYRKGLKRAKMQEDLYNYPKMFGRAVVDATTLVLFCLTWVFGLFCILHEADFAPQFFFCVFLSCTTIMLCLTAKQNRRSFLRDYDYEDQDNGKDKYEKHRKFIEEQSDIEDDAVYEERLSKKYFYKWHYQGAVSFKNLSDYCPLTPLCHRPAGKLSKNFVPGGKIFLNFSPTLKSTLISSPLEIPCLKIALQNHSHWVF
eukprot:TCONS_00054759-protein